MDLHIANTTKQIHWFTYNHPERGRRSLKIEAGTQIRIGNLSSDDVTSIVKQYEIYGIRSSDEMSRLRGFVGFSYRVDKPVPIDAMLVMFDTNGKALDQQAEERTMVEAVAVQEGVAESLHRLTGYDKETFRPAHVEVQNHEDSAGEKPVIDVGVEVPRNASEGRHKGASRRESRQ